MIFTKLLHPEITAEAYFAHRQALLLTPDDINRSLGECIAEIIANVEAFVQRGSGWVVQAVGYMDLHIASYQPLKASSWIALPTCLSKSKAIFKPQKFNDDKCFIYCILAAKHPE